MTPSVSPPRRPPHPPRLTFISSAHPALAQIATLPPTHHIRADLNPTYVTRAPLPGTSVSTHCTALIPHIVLQVLRPANP